MAEPNPGGTPGQVLTKTGYNDYEQAWADPTGGGGGGGTPAATVTNETTFGQPSSVGSSLNYARQDHTHGTQAHELPAGGTAGQQLTKNTNADYDVGWAAAGSAGAAALSVTPIKAVDYTAAAGEFVLFDTAGAARTLTLPAAPPDGTQVGARIATFGTGNFVSVQAGGSDVLNKPASGSTLAPNVLQMNNTGVLYQYEATGTFWTVVATGLSVGVLDSRYTPTASMNTLSPGTDLEILGPTAGVLTIQTTTLAHSFITPLFVEAQADDPAPVVNNVTIKDDPELFVSVSVSAVYAMEAVIIGDSNNTADFRHGWSGPTGATLNWFTIPQGLSTSYTTGNISFGSPTPNLAIGATTQAGMPVAGTVAVMRLQGTLRTSTTAGVFRYRYAQGAADPGNTIRKAGSFLLLRRVA